MIELIRRPVGTVIPYPLLNSLAGNRWGYRMKAECGVKARPRAVSIVDGTRRLEMNPEDLPFREVLTFSEYIPTRLEDIFAVKMVVEVVCMFEGKTMSDLMY